MHQPCKLQLKEKLKGMMLQQPPAGARIIYGLLCLKCRWLEQMLWCISTNPFLIL